MSKQHGMVMRPRMSIKILVARLQAMLQRMPAIGRVCRTLIGVYQVGLRPRLGAEHGIDARRNTMTSRINRGSGLQWRLTHERRHRLVDIGMGSGRKRWN